MKIFDSFLGKGWDFPPVFDKKKRGVTLSAGEENIRKSLQVLLATRVGERIMHPSFGCNLEEMQFENLDISLKTYITDLIETAIIEHEPRIELEEVDIKPSDEYNGVITIKVRYIIRGTNSRFNFVYPFYKNEGTDL